MSPSEAEGAQESTGQYVTRTITNSALRVMELPFPIQDYHVYESRYLQRTLTDGEGPSVDLAAGDNVHVQLKHALLVNPDSGAVRLHATVVGIADAIEARVEVGVLLAFSRPPDRSEDELLKVMSTVGVNSAFGLLRAEVLVLTRFGALGPIMLDPLVLIIEPSNTPNADVVGSE